MRHRWLFPLLMFLWGAVCGGLLMALVCAYG
jgi:hypothetical protein